MKKKWEYERVYQLFTDIKKAYDSIGREVLLYILVEFVPSAYRMDESVFYTIT
jgi:hypothetical protein